SEGARIGAGKAQIAALLPARTAGFAKARIFIDADGDDVERAALVELALALLEQGKGLGRLADGVDERDAHLIASARQRHIEKLLAGRKSPHAVIGGELLDLPSIDLHADHLDGVGGRGDVDADDRVTRAVGCSRGWRPDLELRDGPRNQIGELEGGARSL